MDTSIFLAKIFGPYCIVVALSFLLNRQSYKKIADGILKDAGFRIIGGFLALIIGLLVVNTHNVWVWSWRVIITIFGWLSLIKGICYFMFPDYLAKMAQRYSKDQSLLTFQLSLTLLIGVLLAIKGYCTV